MSSVVIQNYSQYPYSWADRRRDTNGALLHEPEPFYVPARGRDEASGALRPGLCRATEDTVKRARKNAVLGPLFKEGVLRVGSLELLGTLLEVREHEGIMADEAAAKHPTPRQRPGVQLLTAAEMSQQAQ
jgi:hypothetical protein